MALRHGVLPPTINYETPDPDCDLDYIPNQHAEVAVDHVLNNNFGFGGQNVSLVVSRFTGESPLLKKHHPTRNSLAVALEHYLQTTETICRQAAKNPPHGTAQMRRSQERTQTDRKRHIPPKCLECYT